MNEAFRQLQRSGYMPFVIGYHVEGKRVEGIVDVAVVPELRADERFAESGLHHLHEDVGHNRTEFRSHTGELGKGSLQWVICLDDGSFYVDIDRWSPVSDVVGFFGHAGEVIRGWLRGWT